MILRTKIIIGAILGVLWVGLCVFLAFLPEPKSVNLYYSLNVNAHEKYGFSMTDYYASISHTILTGNYEGTEENYTGFITEYPNGGVFTITGAKAVEKANDLELNYSNIHLIGQKNLVPFKFVNDYVVLALNDKYLCLAQGDFVNYDEKIGLYGSELKNYKNPEFDICFKKGETNIVDLLNNQIYAVCASGDCSKKYFDEQTAIDKVLNNNEEFAATKIGKYKLQIKTKDNKEVFVNALVYDETNSPYANYLKISSNSLMFTRTYKNDIQGFLNQTNLAIGVDEKEKVNVSADMIEDLDTSKTGKQLFVINYNGLKYYAEAIINNSENSAIEKISANKNMFVIKQGEDEFLNNISITAKYLNGEEVKNITINNSDENLSAQITGFDKNKCMRQIVTLSYKGKETKILVIVLDESGYNYYVKNNKLPE